MALSEHEVIGRIEITGNGTLQVRTDTIIMRDGVEIAREYSRKCFEPGEDVSSQSEQVQAIATAVWTEQIIAAYEATVR